MEEKETLCFFCLEQGRLKIKNPFPYAQKVLLICMSLQKIHLLTHSLYGNGWGGGLKVLLTWIIRTVSFSQYTFTTHCIAGEGGVKQN
jgi:hypothetical protein